MTVDPRAVRDPVLYNAALNDACAAMQRWRSNGGSPVAELTELVMALRQPLK